MVKVNVISVLIVLNFYTKISGAQSLNEIDFKMVRDLAKQIGDELTTISETATRRAEFQGNFSHAKVTRKNGARIVDEIAKELEAMLGIRIDALKRINRRAQNLERVSDNETRYENYTFINMRKRDKHKSQIDREREERNAIKEQMSQDPNYTKKKKPNYEAPVCFKSTVKAKVEESDDDDDDESKEKISTFNETINMKVKQAGIYLPLDVYDKDINISMTIERSKGLDATFFDNHQREPTIGWQYFCNSSGVFRHFPATSWDFQPMNIYDCRMRHWYTNAASSSKDMIILIEQSGSMTGTRLDIALDVVRNLLDTLSINDFVNVLSFNDTVRSIIDCSDPSAPKSKETNPFFDRFVQATSTNIYDLKQALNDIEPSGQADLAEALEHVFLTLEKTRKKGANCNQVIMLITDGMEYNDTIQGLFLKYNWNKGNPARVFSFLIGEMIPENDYEQVKLMACENRGYYVQIDTKTETREQVLKYIPVMARPLAFNRTQSPIVWSQVYADILEAYRITNYDWNCKQNDVQRARIVRYLKNYQYYPCINEGEDAEISNYRKYVFMTTVSMPSFEQRESLPMLMGVAAIDVPLYEFERLFQQFRLGVNGYAFVIDENGIILSHPDFRPLFQGNLLKPSYNSIDLVEVEFTDDDTKAARDYNSDLINMRKAMIDKDSGSNVLDIIQHFDDLRRVMRFKRHYFWKKIDRTPFSIVVTYSDDLIGQVQIPEHEIDSKTKGSKLLNFFQGNYRLHPDWIYCRSLKKNFEDLKLGEIDPDDCEMTPEEELEYYIEKFETSGWKWKSSSTKEKGAYKCDQKLVQALLFDAKATQNFPNDPKSKDKKIDRFEMNSSFIATHSGLLRFKIYDEDEREHKIKSEKFVKKFRKTIEEDWYKHTVEFTSKEPKSFVYSVPFDASFKLEPEKELITATTAIFAGDGSERAPLAVIGFQFEQEKLLELFGDECAPHVEQVCFILDDNAYIVAHSRKEHVGKFLGSVENKIMRLLMEENIYKDVTIYDYQAVCYDDRNKKYDAIMDILSNSSGVFMNPLKFLWRTLVVAMSTMWSLANELNEYLPNLMYPDPQYYYEDDPEEYCPHENDGSLKQCLAAEGVSETDTTSEKYKKCLKIFTKKKESCRDDLRWSQNVLKRHFNRTRPRRCDKFNYVYVLNIESNFGKPYSNCERPFVVHRIPNSNLILLIAKSDCAKNIYYDFRDKPADVDVYRPSMFCKKLSSTLHRRFSKFCFSHHTHEPSFSRGDNRTNVCGHGNRLELQSIFKLIIPLIIAIVIRL